MTKNNNQITQSELDSWKKPVVDIYEEKNNTQKWARNTTHSEAKNISTAAATTDNNNKEFLLHFVLAPRLFVCSCFRYMRERKVYKRFFKCKIMNV